MLIRRHPLSEKQLAASRANGRKSLGPSTTAGKRHSSRNRLSHGLASCELILPAESREEFRQLRESVRQTFPPRNSVGEDLIDTIAGARWQLARIAKLEGGILDTSLNAHSRLANAQEWAALTNGTESHWKAAVRQRRHSSDRWDLTNLKRRANLSSH